MNGFVACQAADVDDPAAAAAFQVRNAPPQQYRTRRSGSYRCSSLPSIGRHLRDTGGQPDAGVVDEDVQARRTARPPRLRHARRRPEFPTSARTAWTESAGNVFAAASRCFCLRPVMATLAPRPMSAPAIASPIPREPPVTTATVEASRGGESIWARVLMPIRIVEPDGIHCDRRQRRAWWCRRACACRARPRDGSTG